MSTDWNIERYECGHGREWDDFVDASRNGSFLFRRAYMDYHSDRFADCSWMVRKRGRLVAVLPANLTSDGVLQSHGGLTYGGWVLPQAHLDGNDLLEIFTAACGVWREEGIRILDYKPLPWFYAGRPSQEDIYALFRLGANVSEVNMSATIDMRNPGSLNQQQRRHLSKVSGLDVEIAETDDIESFMRVLEDCLAERHGTRPVHTAGEMRMLAARFPDNIKFYVARHEGEIGAAVCIYDTGRVAHAQYIATTPEGRKLNLLTPLFVSLIRDIYSDRDYFDFGISNEDHGRYLNAGLLRQKYSYGATATACMRFELEL